MNNFYILLVCPASELAQKLLAFLRSVGHMVDFCPYLEDMEIMLKEHQYQLVLIDSAADIKPASSHNGPPTEHYYDQLIAGIQHGVPLLRHKRLHFIIIFTRLALAAYQQKYQRDMSLVQGEAMHEIADEAALWRHLIEMINSFSCELS